MLSEEEHKQFYKEFTAAWRFFLANYPPEDSYSYFSRLDADAHKLLTGDLSLYLLAAVQSYLWKMARKNAGGKKQSDNGQRRRRSADG